MIITVSIGFQVKMSPSLGGCVVFPGKTQHCQRISFHPELYMSQQTIEKNSGVGFSCDGLVIIL